MTDDSNNPKDSTTLPGYREVNELLHEGEIEAQRRFGVEGFWNTHNLNAMFHDTIPPNLAESPRVLRRLLSLRRWSHDEQEDYTERGKWGQTPL